MASARTPTSLQSGEDYLWKDVSKHQVYTVTAATNADGWITSGASDTGYGIASKATAGDSSFTSSTTGNSAAIAIFVTGASFTGKLHLLDGRRLSATQTTAGGGTGSARIANYWDESSKLYHNKHWLTFDFPTANTSSRVANAETWTSALRAEVYDWAWQELGGASQMMGTVAYAPTTGVFTFTVAAGSPTGRLHVWTY